MGGIPGLRRAGVRDKVNVTYVPGSSGGMTESFLRDDSKPCEGGANGFLDVDNPLVTGQLCNANSSHNACGVVNTAEIATKRSPTASASAPPTATQTTANARRKSSCAQARASTPNALTNTRSRSSSR